MPRSAMLAVGIVVVGVVFGVIGVVVWQLTQPGPDPLAPPNGVAAPAPTPTAEPADPADPSDEEGPQPPPEAQAFIEAYGVAGSVLHLSVAEREEGPEGRLDVVGDVWVELDGNGVPLRFVGRYYNGGGELVQALYQDRERELFAFLEATRRLGDEAPSCLQESPGDPNLLAASVPFLVDREALEVDGFSPTEEAPPGEPPTTPVDERVGEPDRILDLPSWSAAAIFERFNPGAMAYQYVLLDPDSGLLLGQVALQEMEDGERELVYLQGVGAIHVHAPGPAVDPPFDFEEEIRLCEELEAA